MFLMCDVAICKSEFVHSEQAFSKLQDFLWDDVLSEYLVLAEASVRQTVTIAIIMIWLF